MAIKRKQLDWERIEEEHRAGRLSVCEIARRNGCSEGAIRKKAKKFGWKRDLVARVNKEVRNRVVRKDGLSSSGKEIRTDREIIDAAAEIGADIVLTHRKKILKGRETVIVLLDHLATSLEFQPEIEETIESSDHLSVTQQARLFDAVSLPVQSRVAVNLATAMKTFVTLERQAHNLDATGDNDADNAVLGAPSPIIQDMLKTPEKYTPDTDE